MRGKLPRQRAGLTVMRGRIHVRPAIVTRDPTPETNVMADPITNFITDIPHKERKWKNHTITPLAKSWIAAFENFKQTLKDQKEADEAAEKLKFELAMLALSL